MEFSLKKLPKSEIEIEIKLLAEEFQGFVDKTIFQLGQNLEVEGFRKGKIPKEIVEREVSQDRILKEASQLAIRENYLRVISENNITAIANPEIEILSPLKKGEELAFKVKVSVLPEITLPDYKRIAASCQKKKVIVEEKEIEQALLWLQRSRAKFSQVTRPAQKGDFVEIEFSSPAIEGNTKKKDAFLLGQGHLIEGFEEKLEGMKTGETKNFLIMFPKEHFQKNLAGSEANFEVKMLAVQKMEPPELNDQFAQSLGQFENLAALKRSINQGLNLEKEAQEKQRLHREILQKIIDKVSWEIPKVLIEREQNQMFENFKKEVADKFQISFKDYLKKIQQTEETIKQSLEARAETRIKEYLVLNKIAAIENIRISEKEVKEGVNKILNKYQNIKEAEKEIDLEKLKLYIESELRNEKVLEKLESFSAIKL